MFRKVLIALAFSVISASAALTAPLTLHPNTPMVGEPGLLITGDIGLKAYQGRATTLRVPDAPEHAEALAAQALLLYLPPHTKIIPNIAGRYLSHLGQPTNQLPQGKAAAPLFVFSGERLIKIGDAAATHLALPIDGKRVKQPTLPTGLFVAHARAPKDLSKGVRFDTVLGRAYKNGWVLYRTNMYALNDQFWSAHLVTVPLPHPMRRVLPDGALGPPRTHMKLGGYEGAVLINAD